MSGPNDRRGFLRGLVSLPLIGGGVTLIGQPTAAAEPVSDALLEAYDEFLDLERSWLKWERYGQACMDMPDLAPIEAVFRNRQTGRLFDARTVNSITGYHGAHEPMPSTRAAVVLSAVGFGWREGIR